LQSAQRLRIEIHMSKERKLKQQPKRTGTSAPSGGALAPWFTKHISRRAVGKGIAWTAVLGMAGVTIYKFADTDDNEVNYDSLELQKKEGWDVGSTNRALVFSEGPTAYDSRQKTWSAYDPNYLISIYQPRNSQWQPFFVTTLLQSLSQRSLNSQIRPIRTSAMNESYARAEGLRNLISQSPNANETLIVADLPGPESIAAGAALAETAQLVPIFDNWPHPLGVVRSHETLGAIIYYAHEIEEKKSKLSDNAPVVVLLDSNRLAPYTDQDSLFDNRYLAKLPQADQLKQRGIKQVIYLVKDQNQKQELDDVNDDLVEWQKNGIDVRMLRLSEFKPYDEPVQASSGTTTTTTTTAPGPVQHHYHYGGSPLLSWLFFSHYFYSAPRTVFIPGGGYGRSIPRPSSLPSYEPPNYRPASRPTIFNSSRVGASPGATGVGKTRPSGFGRTSVRVSNDGRVTGTRPGRSGSYGRSGGGWFGG
jgi:hypothetical protein